MSGETEFWNTNCNKEFFDSLHEQFEQSLGLTYTPDSPNECMRLLNIPLDKLRIMTSDQCGEASLILHNFSFRLTKEISSKKALLNYYKECFFKTVSKYVSEIRYLSTDERLAIAADQDDYAKKLKFQIAKLQYIIDRVEYLPMKIDKVADMFNSLQITRRIKNDNYRTSQ